MSRELEALALSKTRPEVGDAMTGAWSTAVMAGFGEDGQKPPELWAGMGGIGQNWAEL